MKRKGYLNCLHHKACDLCFDKLRLIKKFFRLFSFLQCDIFKICSFLISSRREFNDGICELSWEMTT